MPYSSWGRMQPMTRAGSAPRVSSSPTELGRHEGIFKHFSLSHRGIGNGAASAVFTAWISSRPDLIVRALARINQIEPIKAPRVESSRSRCGSPFPRGGGGWRSTPARSRRDSAASSSAKRRRTRVRFICRLLGRVQLGHGRVCEQRPVERIIVSFAKRSAGGIALRHDVRTRPDH